MYLIKSENIASRNALESLLWFTTITKKLIDEKTYQANAPYLSSHAGHTSHSLQRQLARGDQQADDDHSKEE